MWLYLLIALLTGMIMGSFLLAFGFWAMRKFEDDE